MLNHSSPAGLSIISVVWLCLGYISFFARVVRLELGAAVAPLQAGGAMQGASPQHFYPEEHGQVGMLS